MKNVANPKYPCMTKPARMDLISEMPDPAAYLAKERTRCDEINEKAIWNKGWVIRIQESKRRVPNPAHSEYNEDEPPRKSNMAPRMPRITPVDFFSFNLPTTKLLVQPPPIRTVSHLDVRQPLTDN